MPSQKGDGPDSSLTLNPTSATITSGQSVGVMVTLKSIHGLAGTIHVGVRWILPPPSGGNGPTIQQRAYDIPLQADGNGGTLIEFGATHATYKTTYAITITGTDIGGGCCHGLSQSENFMLTVT
jgi:hypothetical protein